MYNQYHRIQVVSGIPDRQTACYIVPMLDAETYYSYYPRPNEAKQLLEAIKDGLEGEKTEIDRIIRAMQYGYTKGREDAPGGWDPEADD